jgi:glycine dehydrogenase subunit 1
MRDDSHSYLPNDTSSIRQRLLQSIGLASIDDAFSDIPSAVRLSERLNLPLARSEAQVCKTVETLLQHNISAKANLSFLGGGAWHHYIPAVVDAVISRGEFLTSYTPYQPEISQGMLQALFEYQSMMGELLEMDVVNSSMYDWATALGEAARMASRVTHRSELLIPHFISPERLATLKVYVKPLGMRIIEMEQPVPQGQIEIEALKEQVSSKTAGLYIENPSYLGFLIDNADVIADIAHDARSLFIIGVDPTSLGLIQPPGVYGADIVVGEGQPLGNYVNYGGPFLGIFACRNETRLLRQMPGRLVGLTTAIDNQEMGFCMVLQTREQHIRREKATSNICTNHALCAVRAAIFLALYGRVGFQQLSEYLFTLTQYATRYLSALDGVHTPHFSGCHFKDFTVTFQNAASLTKFDIHHELLGHGIMGGRALSPIFPELGDTYLYSVSDLHSIEDIRTLGQELRTVREAH